MKDIKIMIELADCASSNGVINDFVNHYGLDQFWQRYQHYLHSDQSSEDFIYGLCELMMLD